MHANMHPALLLLLFSLLTGCAGLPRQDAARSHWPSVQALREAAGSAARSPRTWAPLGGAALASYLLTALAGYALGQFVAAFAQRAFLEPSPTGAEPAFQPMDGGAAIRLTMPLTGQP